MIAGRLSNVSPPGPRAQRSFSDYLSAYRRLSLAWGSGGFARLELKEFHHRHERLEEFLRTGAPTPLAGGRQVGRARRAPDDLLVEQLEEPRDIAATERLITSAYEIEILLFAHAGLRVHSAAGSPRVKSGRVRLPYRPEN
jgi:hypothetical protein